MSVFSRIWTEYGVLPLKSLYSVRIGKNTDQNNFASFYLLQYIYSCTECDESNKKTSEIRISEYRSI